MTHHRGANPELFGAHVFGGILFLLVRLEALDFLSR